MKKFLAHHGEQVAGVLIGFDRIRFEPLVAQTTTEKGIPDSRILRVLGHLCGRFSD